MKKTITILGIALLMLLGLFTNPMYSQGLYVNVGAGYGFAAAPGMVQTEQTSSSNFTSTTTSYKNVSGTGSFGKGVQAGATVGYMFGEHVGAEIGFGYLIGSTLTNKNSSSDLTINSSTTVDAYGTMFRIIPAISIMAGKNKVKPYLKMGIVLGLAPKLNIKLKDNTSYVGGGTYNRAIEENYSGGASFGFAAAVGANFKLREMFGIFGEFGVITQSWAPLKGAVTKYTLNGVDQLSTMTTSEKQVDFVDSYTETTPNNNTSSPSKQLRTNYSFSSVGINIGVRLTFGGKGKKATKDTDKKSNSNG